VLLNSHSSHQLYGIFCRRHPSISFHEHLLVVPVRVNVYRDKILLLAKRPSTRRFRALRQWRCVRAIVWRNRRLGQRLIEPVQRTYSSLWLRVSSISIRTLVLSLPARAVDVRQPTSRIRTRAARRVRWALKLMPVEAGQTLLAESQSCKGRAHWRTRADVQVSIAAVLVGTIPAQEMHTRGNTVRSGLVREIT